MPSHRKRKRQARSRDLSLRELELVELLEEVLDSVRWLQILGYTNQFLLDRHVEVDPVERDRIVDAAARTVDRDRKLGEWRDRLARLKACAAGLRSELGPGDAGSAAGAVAPEAEPNAREGHADG